MSMLSGSVRGMLTGCRWYSRTSSIHQITKVSGATVAHFHCFTRDRLTPPCQCAVTQLKQVRCATTTSGNSKHLFRCFRCVHHHAFPARLASCNHGNSQPSRTYGCHSQLARCYSQPARSYSQSNGCCSQPAQPYSMYSQSTGCYSQPARSYSQSTGCYSQPARSYSQSTGCYSQPARSYSQSTGCYSQPARSYSQSTGCYSQRARRYSQSALYISNLDVTESPVVDVDLDLINRFENLQELTDNIQMRGMDINWKDLHSQFTHLMEQEKVKISLEEERLEIANSMKTLVIRGQKSAALEKKKKEFIARGREVRERLKVVSKQYYELERDVITVALKLPVRLHHSTGTTESQLKQMNFGDVIQASEGDDHISIGRRSKTLTFSNVSPHAYYLHGDLAMLEFKAIELISRHLRGHGVQQLSCPDMVKTMVLEACGVECQDKHKAFTLEPKADKKDGTSDGSSSGDSQTVDKLSSLLHLTGVSPMSFAAYLTKMNIDSACLPLKCFSMGRRYSPAAHCAHNLSGPHGLVGVPQASVVEVFGAARSAVEAEDLYQHFSEMMWSLYEQLQLPVRLVGCSASQLQRVESARQELRVWMPSLNRPVQVGHVSISEDILGRCLNITHNSHVEDVYNKNYIYTVHGTMMCIPTLLAAIIENNSRLDYLKSISDEQAAHQDALASRLHVIYRKTRWLANRLCGADGAETQRSKARIPEPVSTSLADRSLQETDLSEHVLPVSIGNMKQFLTCATELEAILEHYALVIKHVRPYSHTADISLVAGSPQSGALDGQHLDQLFGIHTGSASLETQPTQSVHDSGGACDYPMVPTGYGLLSSCMAPRDHDYESSVISREVLFMEHCSGQPVGSQQAGRVRAMEDRVDRRHMARPDPDAPELPPKRFEPDGDPSGKPNLDQLHVVQDHFVKTLPNIFVKRHNYSIYRLDVVLENNFAETPYNTVGMAKYAVEIAKARWSMYLKYVSVRLEVLKSTIDEEDGTICLYWRIKALPQSRILRFWKFMPWSFRESMEKETDWIDGLSTLYVGGEGLVYKHRIDKMIPYAEKTENVATPNLGLAT